MNPTTIAILAFFAVALAAVAVYSLMRDIAQSDARRIKQRLSETFENHTASSPLFKDLANAAADPFREADQAMGWWKSFQLMVEQAGLSIDARGVLIRSGGVGVVLASVGFVLTRSIWVSLILAVIGFVVPMVYTFHRRDARLEKLRAQLADAYSMMSRVMLAGQTSAQAMQLVAKEFSDPIAGEFAYCNEQQNLGLAPEITMTQLAQRTGLLEVKMFVVAGMVHREAGGNFAEVLENLAQVIRQRFRVRGEVRTLTAEGRFQAAVLLFLPIFIFTIMYLVNPEYMGILFEYPLLIATAFISEVVGAVWIRKIVNFDF